MTGRMLNLERMCVHDGPGIRTTIFLKGCPLSCWWCHNPESISRSPQIGFWPEKCAGCGRCAAACPCGAHLFGGDGHRLDRERCTACGSCVEACLTGALEYHGRQISAEEAVVRVLEDRTFYAKSGGGCTISGGEPLLQSDFCARLLALLGKEGIHRAIDTCGAVPWESFEAVIPGTDLFLYDLKHADDREHREQTGGSNRAVLDNLRRLSECDVPIEIRIPVIPGFNADAASISALGRLLIELPNIVGVRLLPYHPARLKYESLGLASCSAPPAPPDDALMTSAAEILRRQGLPRVR